METIACISFLSLSLTHENLLPVSPCQRVSLFLVPASVCRNLTGSQPPVGPSLYCALLLDIRFSFAVIALFLSHTRCATLCVSPGSCPESGCLDTPGTDFTGPVPSNRRLHRKMLEVRFSIFFPKLNLEFFVCQLYDFCIDLGIISPDS